MEMTWNTDTMIFFALLAVAGVFGYVVGKNRGKDEKLDRILQKLHLDGDSKGAASGESAKEASES